MKEGQVHGFDSFAEMYEQFVTINLGNPWLGWEKLEGENALDIGCGAGQTTERIAVLFDNVVGIDLSPALIELANRKHNKPNIQYITDDLLEYKDKNKYEFVYSHTMMHHLSDYREGSLKIKSFVEKGGKLLIIDNVSDKYQTPPLWAYTLPAKIDFIPNIFRIGLKKALTILAFWHNEEWLAHLANDKYLSRRQFKEIYLEVFPNGEIIDLGFANAIKWINE